MSVGYSQNKLSTTISLAISITASLTIAAIILNITFTLGGNVFASPTPNMTIVDGIRCDTTEFTKFHIHAHLDIFVDGKPYVVPSQIGIDPEGRCLYWLHTHDDSGIIHIESPIERKFTIGNFIDIWDHTFGNTKLFDNSGPNNASNAISVYLNGERVSSNNNNFRNVTINAHDEIALIFGPMEANKIPSRYQFSQGL